MGMYSVIREFLDAEHGLAKRTLGQVLVVDDERGLDLVGKGFAEPTKVINLTGELDLTFDVATEKAIDVEVEEDNDQIDEGKAKKRKVKK